MEDVEDLVGADGVDGALGGADGEHDEHRDGGVVLTAAVNPHDLRGEAGDPDAGRKDHQHKGMVALIEKGEEVVHPAVAGVVGKARYRHQHDRGHQLADHIGDVLGGFVDGNLDDVPHLAEDHPVEGGVEEVDVTDNQDGDQGHEMLPPADAFEGQADAFGDIDKADEVV